MNLLHTAHVPSGDGPFPAVVAIHGWGASAHDLIGLAPILQRGEALVLSPEGPVEVPIGEGIVGHGWFPITPGRPSDPAAIRNGITQLETFLDEALRHYPADPKKVSLLGFSQGGVMGFDLFLRCPERFSGLAALSTWLPPELAAAAPPGPAHAHKPVLLMHGTDDPMIPVDRARETRDALLPYEVSLTYREFGMGHEIAPDALRELVVWYEEKLVSPIQLIR